MDLAIVHIIALLVAIGYGQDYWFHLRKLLDYLRLYDEGIVLIVAGHHKNNAH